MQTIYHRPQLHICVTQTTNACPVLIYFSVSRLWKGSIKVVRSETPLYTEAFSVCSGKALQGAQSGDNICHAKGRKSSFEAGHLITYLECKPINSYCIHSLCLCLFKNTVPCSKSTAVNTTDKVPALMVLTYILNGETQNTIRNRKINKRISCP